jgi:ubiquinone/menaquinone biosynthesis C-methylase UbiE
MSELRFDDEATKRLLAVYVTPDVAAQRHAFLQALEPQPGERVLDVGCGPGLLASGIAVAVGSSGAVHGIDLSESLLAAARAQCANQPWVELRHGDAMRLPYADATFDAAISTQVLEYVSDVDRALAELRRVLRPGGRAVLVDTDWDSIVWHSRDAARMNRVLAAWEKHAADVRLPRTLAPRMRRAGFEVRSQQVLPLFNPAWDPDTYSGQMIPLIAAFLVRHGGIERDEVTRWVEDLKAAGESGDYFFSLNRYVFVARAA